MNIEISSFELKKLINDNFFNLLFFIQVTLPDKNLFNKGTLLYENDVIFFRYVNIIDIILFNISTLLTLNLSFKIILIDFKFLQLNISE